MDPSSPSRAGAPGGERVPRSPVEMSLPLRSSSVDDLLDPDRLASLLEVDEPVTVEQLTTLGYSGSRFYLVSAGDGFIVKETVLCEDWFSNRTEDEVGRKAAALLAAELAPIHEIFALPNRAVAVQPRRIALLMEDISPWLLPDERAPIDRDDESLIVDTLARLHATSGRRATSRRSTGSTGPSISSTSRVPRLTKTGIGGRARGDPPARFSSFHRPCRKKARSRWYRVVE